MQVENFRDALVDEKRSLRALELKTLMWGLVGSVRSVEWTGRELSRCARWRETKLASVGIEDLASASVGVTTE